VDVPNEVLCVTPLFITCKLRNDSLRLESGQSFKMVLFDNLIVGGAGVG